MTIERKLLSTSPSDDAPDVAEAFSTHLYTGNGGTNVINNGIDLAGEGGMVWAKCRSATGNHSIFDTERGASKLLYGLGTAAETTSANSLTSFNSNGFTLGADDTDGVNKNTRSHVAWTFRKKKKFFDVVTYSGNGASSRAISHGLNGAVGWMVVKRTSAAEDWTVWHRSLAGTSPFMNLNSTGGSSTAETIWTATEPTSTAFTVGSHNRVNASGHTYVAYLWADNSAEDAEEQMIKCGSYTGTGSAGLAVNLGWEPQFVIIKNASSSTEWMMQDTMRGMSHYGWKYIIANDNSQESGAADAARVAPTPTGFTVNNNGSNAFGQSGNNVIYIAIRAPMMKEPEAATDVFGISNAMTQPLPAFNSTFPIDMSLNKRPAYGQNISIGSRLQGTKHLYTDTIGAEVNEVEYVWDYMDGWGAHNSNNSDYRSWNWKRAKGFMDVVAYDGNNSNTVKKHSLGVIPEMIIYKCRSNGASNRFWTVYHASEGPTKYQRLNEVYGNSPAIDLYQTTPTATQFNVVSGSVLNETGYTYIAYLFATLDGISKVGSYTGNGSYQTINCGFSAGSRFVLIRRTDANGDWYVWDSNRGIVAGNDPHMSLNNQAAQVTNDDSVDPHNSGFIVNQVSATNINVSSGTYIFYAIA